MSDRNTPWRNGDIVAAPVAAATMIYGGHMVAANAAGLAVPASAVAAQVTLGVSDEYADNTAGAAAATSVMSVAVRPGSWRTCPGMPSPRLTSVKIAMSPTVSPWLKPATPMRDRLPVR
jgi:hypothetical protein